MTEDREQPVLISVRRRELGHRRSALGQLTFESIEFPYDVAGPRNESTQARH